MTRISYIYCVCVCVCLHECVCMCMCACGGAYPTPICLHNCQVLYGNGAITQLTGLLFG